jgi:hypothetical protein
MNDPFPDLNLMDWKPNHLMALVHGTDVYIWNAKTNSAELFLSLNYDLVCSVGWTQHGNYLAVGIYGSYTVVGLQQHEQNTHMRRNSARAICHGTPIF